MKYTRFDESSVFTDLDEIDSWLAGRGITQRNRLRIYHENLIAMREREKTAGAQGLYEEVLKAGRANEMLASYVEGWEIVDAIKCLRAGQVYIPDELLKRALDGPPDASRESPKNNQGRNAMFELSIGAMLARQKLLPIFSTGNPDVEFQFEDRRVLVECKRVLSENRTLPVISDGIHQLGKQISKSSGDVGLVAVDISRVIYQGDGYWSVPENSHVRAILSEMIRKFIDGIKDGILQKKNSVAMGALFYAASPFRVEGLGYTPARTGTFCAFDTERNEFLARLASSIKL